MSNYGISSEYGNVIRGQNGTLAFSNRLGVEVTDKRMDDLYRYYMKFVFEEAGDKRIERA